MYVLGVDVGGSKTACFVSDEKGNILAKGFGGPGNHQVCGIDVAKKSMETAVLEGLDGAGLSKKDITYALFGISGADGPEDFRILKPAVKEIMGDAVFHIVNDTWLGLRAGTKDNVGVVSICGTGAGHAGRNRAGRNWPSAISTLRQEIWEEGETCTARRCTSLSAPRREPGRKPGWRK